MEKKRNSSFLVAAARESASHQPLLDLMSSNGRLKFILMKLGMLSKLLRRGWVRVSYMMKNLV